jgi:hypothetical protein
VDLARQLLGVHYALDLRRFVRFQSDVFLAYASGVLFHAFLLFDSFGYREIWLFPA